MPPCVIFFLSTFCKILLVGTFIYNIASLGIINIKVLYSILGVRSMFFRKYFKLFRFSLQFIHISPALGDFSVRIG